MSLPSVRSVRSAHNSVKELYVEVRSVMRKHRAESCPTPSVLPEVLGVQPGARVLDMCASPGSKTAQLLERVGPGGLVVANDQNPERIPTLQCAGRALEGVRRLCSTVEIAHVTLTGEWATSQRLPSFQRTCVLTRGDNTCPHYKKCTLLSMYGLDF